jgi:hydrogenase-4 component B
MALTVVLAAVAILLIVSALSLLPHSTALGRILIYGGSLALCGIGLVVGLSALLGQAPPETLMLPIGLPWLGAHFRLDALSAFFLVVVISVAPPPAFMRSASAATRRRRSACCRSTRCSSPP